MFLYREDDVTLCITSLLEFVILNWNTCFHFIGILLSMFLYREDDFIICITIFLKNAVDMTDLWGKEAAY